MTGFSDQQVQSLDAPLSRANVKEREQSGRKLSYIESWVAIAEANRIFGYDGWDRETVDLRLLGEPRMVGDKARVGYMAKVRVTVRAGDKIVVREGCGFGSGIDKDVDQAHESAIKEAESDAGKRALMTFGNPFGLALYDKTQANVVVAPPPRSQALIMGEASLVMCRNEAEVDEWGVKNKAALEQMTKEERAILVAAWKAEKAKYAPKQEAA
jgi:DNA repair and recombination protein RAD52